MSRPQKSVKSELTASRMMPYPNDRLGKGISVVVQPDCPKGLLFFFFLLSQIQKLSRDSLDIAAKA